MIASEQEESKLAGTVQIEGYTCRWLGPYWQMNLIANATENISFHVGIGKN